MRLVVLGATGGIGREIVRQAVERHHSVTAFVRVAESLRPFAGQISVMQGNLLDSHELGRAIAGHDAVLSAFGPRVPIAKTDAHLLRDFSVALTDAMTRTGVRRGLVVSTAFLFKDAIFPPAHLVGRLFFPGVVADATDMEDVLRASKLDLTIVRPPQLNDRPHSGKFRARKDHLPFAGVSIPRADVADFMTQAVEAGTFRSAIVGVCA
jgi:putative NADH-flavin reductase